MKIRSSTLTAVGAVLLSLAATPLAAQDDAWRTDLALPSSSGLYDAATAPSRPQVPFADELSEEVVVYGEREPLGLPNTVRAELWRAQRREMEALMLERERTSTPIPLAGVDAVVGTHLRIRLLPTYDPMTERRLEYRIQDSMPVGLINLFCAAFGGPRTSVDLSQALLRK